jgi:hypothetical protein
MVKVVIKQSPTMAATKPGKKVTSKRWLRKLRNVDLFYYKRKAHIIFSEKSSFAFGPFCHFLVRSTTRFWFFEKPRANFLPKHSSIDSHVSMQKAFSRHFHTQT